MPSPAESICAHPTVHSSHCDSDGGVDLKRFRHTRRMGGVLAGWGAGVAHISFTARGWDSALGQVTGHHAGRFHMQTLIIYNLVFNQNYKTFTLILLIEIVMCSDFA